MENDTPSPARAGGTPDPAATPAQPNAPATPPVNPALRRPFTPAEWGQIEQGQVPPGHPEGDDGRHRPAAPYDGGAPPAPAPVTPPADYAAAPRRPFTPAEWGQIEQGQVPPGHPVAAAATTDDAEDGDDSEDDQDESDRKGKTRSLVKDIVETLLLALVIYLGVRAGVQNFKVEGSSMEPSLHNGQYLLVNKLAYATFDLDGIASMVPGLGSLKGSLLFPFGQPQRGDVVVFQFPRDTSRDFIKRVVALPGETVEVRNGVVYVNNKQLTEPYIESAPTYSKEPTTVPLGEYYVLGDNRNNSSDSHVWGPVPITKLIGKAWVTYWPMKDVGFIPHLPAQASN